MKGERLVKPLEEESEEKNWKYSVCTALYAGFSQSFFLQKIHLANTITENFAIQISGPTIIQTSHTVE